MGTIKDSALGIAQALADAHDEADTPALNTLHTKLRQALYEHGEEIGLTSDDIAEIDNFGPQARGGTPKGPAPTPE